MLCTIRNALFCKTCAAILRVTTWALIFAAVLDAQNALPRVGPIKNYDLATKNIEGGCDNHFVTFRGEKRLSRVIFISLSDGSSAWMNLNGNDVELQLVKATIAHQELRDRARVEYRYGTFTVVLTYDQMTDYVGEYPVSIRISAGRGVRTLRAVGQPQCDAI
jgi:hypothetical protein